MSYLILLGILRLRRQGSLCPGFRLLWPAGPRHTSMGRDRPCRTRVRDAQRSSMAGLNMTALCMFSPIAPVDLADFRTRLCCAPALEEKCLTLSER